MANPLKGISWVLEKTVKAAVHRRLRKIGAYQHWPVQMGMGDRTLDCIGCYMSYYFGVECKAPGKKTTKIQDYTIEQIREAGGIVFVVDSVESANAIFADHPSTYAAITRSIRPNFRVVAGRQDG